MKAERFMLALVACVLGAGCGGEGSEALELEDTEPLALPVAAPATPRPTLDEFAASLRQTIQVGDQDLDAYVLEGDMLVPYEMVVAYYEALYPSVQPKGVGVVVGAAGPSFTPPPFLTRDMPVRYCYEATFSEDEREEIDVEVARAMSTWASVANVSFERVFSLDGAACTPEAGGKDIRVFRFNTRIGQGSFPLERNQILGTPYPPLPSAVYLHEVGHLLALAHEIFHSDSPCPQLVPEGLSAQFPSTRNQNLSARIDPKSIMFTGDVNGNPVCQRGTTPNVILSAGDGEAARRLYGP